MKSKQVYEDTSLPLPVTEWSSVEPSEHAGEPGTAIWRTQTFSDIRVRIVEYTAGYVADHWCCPSSRSTPSMSSHKERPTPSISRVAQWSETRIGQSMECPLSRPCFVYIIDGSDDRLGRPELSEPQRQYEDASIQNGSYDLHREMGTPKILFALHATWGLRRHRGTVSQRMLWLDGVVLLGMGVMMLFLAARRFQKKVIAV